MQMNYFGSLCDNDYLAYTMECVTHLQPPMVMVYYPPHTEQLDLTYGLKCLYPDTLIHRA